MYTNTLLSNFIQTFYQKMHINTLETDHMSMEALYSVDPNSTSGGRYHRVTTSFEYVLVGTDFALASPKSASFSSPLWLISRFWGFRSLLWKIALFFFKRAARILILFIYMLTCITQVIVAFLFINKWKR